MLYIASDHIGLKLKEAIIGYLAKKKFWLKDLGTYSQDRVDYPQFAIKLCREVSRSTRHRGILICGTGVGMSIMANRFRKIRGALCFNSYTAEMSRKHNNANVLCLGARVTTSKTALSILRIFLLTKFDGGRHIRRVKQLSGFK